MAAGRGNAPQFPTVWAVKGVSMFVLFQLNALYDSATALLGVYPRAVKRPSMRGLTHADTRVDIPTSTVLHANTYMHGPTRICPEQLVT